MRNQHRIFFLALTCLMGISNPLFADECESQWKIQDQQSEGFEISQGPCKQSTEQPFSDDTTLIALQEMGRVVLTKMSDANELELVCDNNSSQTVSISVGQQKNQIGLNEGGESCGWNNSVYRCSSAKTAQVFCSLSQRVAVNYGKSPIASTSVAMRSSIFPFKYKEDIKLGVKDIERSLLACRVNKGNVESIQASWFISNSGQVSGLELAGTWNTEKAEKFQACVKHKISNYVFTKHEFTTQYWVQTFKVP